MYKGLYTKYIYTNIIYRKAKNYNSLDEYIYSIDSVKERKKFNYRKFYLKYSPSIYDLCICTLCGKLISEDNMQVDHIIPLAKGGKNRWRNTVATCSICNNRKSDILTIPYVLKGVLGKSLEIFIILFKFLIKGIFYILYSSARFIILLLLLPLQSKELHLVLKFTYIVFILELVKKMG